MRQDTSMGKDFLLLKLNFNTSRKKCKVGQHQAEHCVKKTKQSKNQNQPWKAEGDYTAGQLIQPRGQS